MSKEQNKAHKLNEAKNLAGDKSRGEKMANKLPFGMMNYILMGLAVALIIIGYFSLSSGSITLAPILLILGYCLFFPIGIIWRGRGKRQEAEG